MTTTAELKSQIDTDHWTVRFTEGEWKDKLGDFKIKQNGLEEGQIVEVDVTLLPKITEPTVVRYCGTLNVTKVLKPKKK